MTRAGGCCGLSAQVPKRQAAGIAPASDTGGVIAPTVEVLTSTDRLTRLGPARLPRRQEQAARLRTSRRRSAPKIRAWAALWWPFAFRSCATSTAWPGSRMFK
jgi:hypothetical protein